jgi:RNA polymerase sigma factor for flagellar operon FliA
MAGVADEADAREAALWQRWRAEGDNAARQDLVEMHLGFARIMAARLYARRYNDELEFAEYLQYAIVGLIECVDRFTPGQEATFRTFSAARIRGAVLDGVGRMSERQQQIGARQRMLAERTGALARQRRTDNVFDYLADVALGLACGYMLEGTALYIDQDLPVAENQYTRIELHQLQMRMKALIDELPDGERSVIRHHYLNQLPLTAIAQLLSLSAARITQLHASALARLRKAVKEVRACDIAW